MNHNNISTANSSESRRVALEKIKKKLSLVGKTLEESHLKEACELCAEEILKDSSTNFDVCIVRIVYGEYMEVRGTRSLKDIPEEKKGYEKRSIYNKGYTGDVYRYRKNIEINKIDKKNIDTFSSKEWIQDFGLKSFFCFPLTASNETLGLISLFKKSEYSLNDGDRKFMMDISLLFGEYYENIKTIIHKSYEPTPKSQAMVKVDPSLIHEFIIKNEKSKRENKYIEPISIPIIFRVDESLWKGVNIKNFKEIRRDGNMIFGRGSLESVEALNNENAVIYIEASNVYSY
jgi:hypothetical protein